VKTLQLGRHPKASDPSGRIAHISLSEQWPLRAATAALILIFLSACADKPPIVSADTSCERFRHISATPAQIKVFADNWEVMETYADQIVAFNIEYDRHCVGEAK
jgi:hypothetical protein